MLGAAATSRCVAARDAKTFVVDSHQHFWDPHELATPPPPPKAAILGRAYRPADLETEIRAVGVDYTVLVQGYPQSVEANRWLFKQANATPFVAGVVAWLDLQAPERAGAAIERLKTEPKFAGIRHVVEDESDIDWIVRPPVIESLRQLARARVPFDMLVRPQHLPNVLQVIAKVPDLDMVIDHIAKPPIVRGTMDGWARQMTEIGRHPRVYCKVSGMITEADWQRWKPADLRPYIQHVLEAFGWDRVMYGSDWPVCLLAGSYRRVWDALHEALGPIAPPRNAGLFGANATKFYGLQLAARVG
jgi:L-fuconolactonase